jgi:hypothetical protein
MRTSPIARQKPLIRGISEGNGAQVTKRLIDTAVP